MRNITSQGKDILPTRSDFGSRVQVVVYPFFTHRNAFVFAPSGYSTSIDADAIPPAASRADAKNNTLTGMVDDMARAP